MRVFVAGATGVLGSRVVPLLVDRGFLVAGMTRSAGKAGALRSAGALPVVCDVYDTLALDHAVFEFRPELMLHLLTDLPDDEAEIPDRAGANARMRREGTSNLLAAVSAAGTRRFVAQSVAWQLAGDGGAAVEDLESMVLGADGVVLRFGQFYGPGTYHPAPPSPPRVHIDTAARRTVDALDEPSGIVTIVDDP
jgi:nucleoside-diphosphate-sugar epimerase